MLQNTTVQVKCNFTIEYVNFVGFGLLSKATSKSRRKETKYELENGVYEENFDAADILRNTNISALQINSTWA